MKILKHFCLLLILVFAMALAPVKTIESSQSVSAKDTITFIHISDPHICNLNGYHPFFIEKRKHFGNNTLRLTEFLKTMPEKYNCDFLTISGDNIDYFEAQTEKSGMLGTQIEQFARLLDYCNVPVYLTLGNHDIASYFVSPSLEYTNNQLSSARARAAWIKNVNSFKDGTYYSRILKIDTTTFRFIFLDNGYYRTKELSDPALPFLMDQSQLLWLDDQLKASDSDIEIIFMHIPISYKKSDDKIIKTEQLSVYSQKSDYYNILNILEKHSSTRLIFVGHNHDNIINNYTYSNGNTLTQVMTGCFGRDYESDNWRIIKIAKNSIKIYFPGSSSEIEYTILL